MRWRRYHPAEVKQFIAMLKEVRAAHGITIIWVEHIFWVSRDRRRLVDGERFHLGRWPLSRWFAMKMCCVLILVQSNGRSHSAVGLDLALDHGKLRALWV